jgi:hypothetical protein
MVRKPRLIAWGIAIVLLLVGTTMPGDIKSEIEGQLSKAWPWAASAHFILFAIIAGIPVYGSGRAWPVRALLLALFLAVLTEWLQQFVPGRHPLVRDGLIDLSGAALGLAAGFLCVRRAGVTRNVQARGSR